MFTTALAAQRIFSESSLSLSFMAQLLGGQGFSEYCGPDEFSQFGLPGFAVSRQRGKHGNVETDSRIVEAD